MNIYTKKQRWKAILFITALIIIGLSMAYTNWLVDKISKEEERKITLWAKTVSEKAELVRFTNDLFDRFGNEERKKSEIWAKSVQYLVNAPAGGDVSFLLDLVKSNETVPVILVLENGMFQHRNLDPKRTMDSTYLYEQLQEMKKANPPVVIELESGAKNYLYYKDSKLFVELRYVLDEMLASFLDEILLNSASTPVIYTDNSQKNVLHYANIENGVLGSNSKKSNLSKDELLEQINSMKAENEPIKVELHDGTFNYIFYKKSFLLQQLKFFPLIQLFIIGLFVWVSYSLFSSARKTEQNQVWVGMSKETAHQLGTPISSLMAWLELLKMKFGDEPVLDEIKRDINRLEIITDRFSKIGSDPELTAQNLEETISESINYLKKRISKKVIFTLENHSQNPVVKMNTPLFGWVIENLSKNAVDAMDGVGSLSFVIQEIENKIVLDISDTGKGVPKNKFESIFKPGYTTKKRGWGLGLTLVKRIIENYHAGNIYVKSSTLGKGTTFRIEFKKGL
jgi:nitrogen-specific signal transduction histidine kinase